MFIAGGSAYCNISVNWYKEYDPTIPKWCAALTTRTPNGGNMTNLIAMIPMMTDKLAPDPLRPGGKKSTTSLL